MRKLLIFLFFLLLTTTGWSQKKAVTEEGNQIILYDNGTWKYVKDRDSSKSLSTNPIPIRKPATATFLLKSTKFEGIGIWLDPKQWQFKKGENNEDAEFEMQLKGQDLYAMVISEKIEIPIESLQEIALENASKVAPDITIVKEEYRMVNNLKVLFMQMDGTAKGIKISFCGYYFSNDKGTIQLVIYTAQNLLANYTKQVEELLAGLTTFK